MIFAKNNLMKNRSHLNHRVARGYALVELLFYIILFSILSLLVIDSIITMARAFKETTIQTELAESSAVMERISREIRGAYDINTIATSDLKLNTKDDAGVNKTVEFLLSGSDVQLLENSVLTGNLNTPNLTISDLIFTQVTTTAGKAIKVSFIVRSNNDVQSRPVDFYNTVVLRGSY